MQWIKLQKHVYKLNEQLCIAYLSFSSPFYFHAEPWINSIISMRNNKFDTTESIWMIASSGLKHLQEGPMVQWTRLDRMGSTQESVRKYLLIQWGQCPNFNTFKFSIWRPTDRKIMKLSIFDQRLKRTNIGAMSATPSYYQFRRCHLQRKGPFKELKSSPMHY